MVAGFEFFYSCRITKRNLSTKGAMWLKQRTYFHDVFESNSEWNVCR
jgi:hypothetical protein